MSTGITVCISNKPAIGYTATNASIKNISILRFQAAIGDSLLDCSLALSISTDLAANASSII